MESIEDIINNYRKCKKCNTVKRIELFKFTARCIACSSPFNDKSTEEYKARKKAYNLKYYTKAKVEKPEIYYSKSKQRAKLANDTNENSDLCK
jgi:hypothetical protein